MKTIPRAFVLWFTGLSGSGKTTIALELKKKLERRGKTVEIIDGDSVRRTHNKSLGFSREDIQANNQIIARLAKEKVAAADFVLVPVISPYTEDRRKAMAMIGVEKCIELFVNAPLETCIERDVKGLYKKALRGEIENFIGISPTAPYEKPESPDIEIKTNEASIQESVEAVIKFLKGKKHL